MLQYFTILVLALCVAAESICNAQDNLNEYQVKINVLLESIENAKKNNHDKSDYKIFTPFVNQLSNAAEIASVDSPQNMVFTLKAAINKLDFNKDNIPQSSEKILNLYISILDCLVDVDVWNPLNTKSIDTCKLQLDTLIWKNRVNNIRDTLHAGFLIRRKNDIGRVLRFWSKILSYISDDPEMMTYKLGAEFNVIKGYKIPWEHFGPVILSNYAMPPSKLIKDEKIRREYEFFLEKMNEFLRKRDLHITASAANVDYSTKITAFIIDQYSISPRRDDELTALLEKYDFPEEEKAKIFKALNIPYKGFREWQTNDGLFKPTAKFVFYDAKVKEATLEREDGKRMSIEWSALRKEDQEYIRRQIELDQEKLKD